MYGLEADVPAVDDRRQLVRGLGDDDHAAISIIVRSHGRARDERLRAQQALGLAAPPLVARLAGRHDQEAPHDIGLCIRVDGAQDADRRLPPLSVTRIIRRPRLDLNVADDLSFALHRVAACARARCERQDERERDGRVAMTKRISRMGAAAAGRIGRVATCPSGASNPPDGVPHRHHAPTDPRFGGARRARTSRSPGDSQSALGAARIWRRAPALRRRRAA